MSTLISIGLFINFLLYKSDTVLIASALFMIAGNIASLREFIIRGITKQI